LPRVYSLSDNRACTSELLAREQEARGKRLGLWASSAYRIEDAGDAERLGRLIHSYQLIEGRVLNVGESSSRLYLNFTGDWRSDFTISIARKDAAAGLDSADARRQALARAWLARLAERPHDRGHPSRPDRAFACGRRRSERQAPATAKGYRALTAAMP
jgi:hypothetical protein